MEEPELQTDRQIRTNTYRAERSLEIQVLITKLAKSKLCLRVSHLKAIIMKVVMFWNFKKAGVLFNGDSTVFIAKYNKQLPQNVSKLVTKPLKRI